ncbi:hypothetical protein ACSBR2_011479 [Camellia fascicularis]
MTVSRILLSEVHSHTRFPHCRITDQSHSNLRLKMAYSSTNNSNIRLKPRMCDCGATMYIVQTNENGNQGHLFFVCLSKYSNKEHCNYFKFADNDDGNITSTIHSNTGPRKAIRIEKLNDVRTRLSEIENEICDHGRRLQRIDKNFKAMIYVIVVCIILYFIM